ncbi:MAG: Fis family transcriptional regulator [Gemmatimonadetes bacterium]|nr:MAG: Fis family transcriptional regulator [Gemmatimonadota bacterium]
MRVPPTDTPPARAPHSRPGRVRPTLGPCQLTAELKATIRVLIVDDDRTLRESCASVLQYEGYQVSLCSRGDEARETLKRNRFDIVLLDLYMPEVSGLRLLRTCLEAHSDTIVLVITGNPSVDSSLDALRAGAWDYLPKPFSATHLQILVGRAAHTVTVARESLAVQAEFEREHGNSEHVTVLGASPAFRRAVGLARRVAPTEASVFITGESGSGKELIAQFIHHHSRRSSRPLVAVNCAALPEALLESEMFGHCKGAFTGAVRDKPGLLEAANGGTLLLDELVDMSKPIQAKLLRVIQDGVVRRVGSETTDAVVNVRFIACTNRNPEEAVKTGALREDLYYRLRVVPIHVPPLRERPADIQLLAEYFLKQYWTRHRGATVAVPRLSEAALRALRARPWKGNVRELENVVEHLVVLLEPGDEVAPDAIPALGDELATEASATLLREVTTEEPYYDARDRLVAEFELRYLSQLVSQAGGNMSRAARAARVDRTTLYRLLERHGLHRRPVDPPDDEPVTRM